jgi:glycosyltransferase involved in cell wall biosynthesis
MPMKNKDKKHILFLTPGFPANEKDSSCIPALQLFVKELAGHSSLEISIIATHYPYSSKPYTWQGIKIIPLGTRQNNISKLFAYVKLQHLLKKLHRNHKIDIIHCSWLNRVSLIANRFCIRNQLELVITLMGQDARPNNPVLKKMDSLKARLVTLSDYQDRLLKKHFKNVRTTLIHWGMEKEIGDDSKPHNERKIDVIFVGGLSEVKDPFKFIEVLELVKREKPHLKAVITGEGVLEKKVKELVIKKGLDETITFTGKLSRGEVLNIMGKTKVMLHTASYESFGMVYIEALAHGCKVVSHPVGLAYEDKNIKTAITVDELAAAVIDQLSKPGVVYRNDYKIEKSVKKYLDLYNLR